MTPEDVLKFWLDEIGESGWYRVDPAIDTAIIDRFGAGWQAARTGAFAGWDTRPRGALALLILLDQFPRNMFRGHADAYATDARARRVARGAMARGLDREVPEPERQFFYMPLMHSEVASDQCACIRQFMLHMPRDGAKNLPHAIKHRDVIRRFGRFPSRNAALGRADTPAELAYRAEGGYMS